MNYGHALLYCTIAYFLYMPVCWLMLRVMKEKFTQKKYFWFFCFGIIFSAWMESVSS